MKHIFIKSVLAMAVVIPMTVSAAQIPKCATQAAVEFNVPVKVFKALVVQSTPQSKDAADISVHFGPMGLYTKAIEVAAKGINVSADDIKNNACTNYRAAAWWLAVPSDINGTDDVWTGVNRYFYGNNKLPTYPMTEDVKAVFNKLDS